MARVRISFFRYFGWCGIAVVFARSSCSFKPSQLLIGKQCFLVGGCVFFSLSGF